MKREDISELMRDYEAEYETVLPKRLWPVVRLDGRGFTKLTKTGDEFEKPFDIRFHDAMLATVTYLMECGFDIPFGYTQSDEISIVISPDDGAFGRRVIKMLTVLSGEASAFFSNAFERIGVFDARLLALPDAQTVADYLNWRQADATRNALSSHCYWALRRQGLSANKATKVLNGATVSEKNELLFERGINFNDLPAWQRRGSCVVWETYRKEGFNPQTEETVWVDRRRLTEDRELPMKAEFRSYVEQVLQAD